MTENTREGAARQAVALPSLAVPDAHWLFASLLAAALLVLAMLVPVWKLKLIAPQYPDGLYLTAYGYKMVGDIREINNLNHYIGMRPIEPEKVWELKLFIVAMPVLIVAVIGGGFFFRKRWQRNLLRAAVWVPPFFMLADLQYWLYTYGHTLDPRAALRLDPFTPRVIGPTRVFNFSADAMVDVGFFAMVAAAVVLTVGPTVTRWLVASWRNTGAAALAVATLVVLLPAGTSDADGSVSLQALIDGAEPGATIVVPPGRYEERVVVDRRLTLEGGGAATIDGGGVGDVVTIAAEGVTLRGFVIEGSGTDVSKEPAGIRVLADGATIEGNELRDVLFGVVLQDSEGHVVRGNRIRSYEEFPVERRGHGVYLFNADRCTVEGNEIFSGKDGIFVGFSNDNIIRHNYVTGVRYGIHYMYSDRNEFANNRFVDNIAGAAVMYSVGVRLEENTFEHNRSEASGYGILLKDVDDIYVVRNRMVRNRIGMTMDGVPRSPDMIARIEGNLIAGNQIGVQLFSSVNATFVGNAFLGNLEDVRSLGGHVAARNRWADEGRGNYWDRYKGYDADGDGVGDVPFVYRDLLARLREEVPALQAFAYSPAQLSLELMAQWMPALEYEELLRDPAPLMSPPGSVYQGEARSAVDVAVPLLVAGGATGVALLARRRVWPT